MKYKDKGVEVLGFNCADDADIAREFLKLNKVTFPTILDTSQEATDICYRKYQTGTASAVPLTYIISPDGLIVEGWYGYERGHPRGLKALKERGVE